VALSGGGALLEDERHPSGMAELHLLSGWADCQRCLSSEAASLLLKTGESIDCLSCSQGQSLEGESWKNKDRERRDLSEEADGCINFLLRRPARATHFLGYPIFSASRHRF
jgi:hypothetical protein